MKILINMFLECHLEVFKPNWTTYLTWLKTYNAFNVPKELEIKILDHWPFQTTGLLLDLGKILPLLHRKCRLQRENSSRGMPSIGINISEHTWQKAILVWLRNHQNIVDFILIKVFLLIQILKIKHTKDIN